jgi:hypothetical protein
MLEFPEDRTTWDEGNSSDTKCTQEYMLGPWFLLRPVYEPNTITQTTMWLPGTSDDKWIYYWDGKVTNGAQNVSCVIGKAPDSYDAANPPVIPVWVREGAIVPMWPEQYYNSSKQLQRPNSPLQNPSIPGIITVDAYPHRNKTTTFSMYDDDGLTREYKQGKFTRTEMSNQYSGGIYEVNIGASVGDYTGKPASRTFMPTIHTGIIPTYKDQKPAAVTINGTPVAEKADSASLVASTEGWWWNSIKNGIAYVKTKAVPSNSSVKVNIYMPGTGVTVADITSKDILKNFTVVYNSGKISLSFANNFSGSMKASVYSLQGKLLVNKSIQVKNSRAAFSDDTLRTISGNYLLRLEYNGKTVYRKFVALN